MDKIYCIKCGREISRNHVYCGYCGEMQNVTELKIKQYELMQKSTQQMANGGILLLIGLIINYLYYIVTDEYIISGSTKTLLEIMAVIGVLVWIYSKIK